MKPKKLTIVEHVHIYKPTEIAIWNSCHDKWEEHIPTVEELSKIIQEVKYVGMVKHYRIIKEWADEIAEVIHKRLET